MATIEPDCPAKVGPLIIPVSSLGPHTKEVHSFTEITYQISPQQGHVETKQKQRSESTDPAQVTDVEVVTFLFSVYRAVAVIVLSSFYFDEYCFTQR